VTEKVITRIQELMHAKPTYTWSWLQDVLADEFPNERTFTSSQALRAWYRRNSDKKEVEQAIGKTVQHIPLPLPKPFDPIMELPGKSTLVLADLHCPYHDKEFISAAVDNAVRSLYDLGQIIIAGDLLDLDSLSRYSKAHNIAKLESELEITGKMILYLAEFAPVFITHGNHEARWFDTLNTPMSFQRLISAALNGRQTLYPVTTTERDYVFVGSNFVVGHLDKGSSIPGKLAHSVAQKYKRHVLTGHEHITGIFKGNPTAEYLGVSIGCCADPTKFWYSERRLNSSPFMTNGYAMIDGDGDSFSLYDGNHSAYFARVKMLDGVYNCYKYVE